jgi:hypothetical protein
MDPRSGDLPRWVFAVVLLLCVLGLLLWARGLDHHRGEDVGALNAGHPSTQRLES